ncbi:MAG: methyltransferase domain-containing protein [Armatimonadetes bacterium]|nr:methyltransferase domain-containing protein [Armatimonadota bacterium]
MQDWYVEEMSPVERHSHLREEILFRGQTAFQEVVLARNRAYGKILFLDGDIQSAQLDERAYHEALVHPALIALPRSPRSVLVLGGGEGATVREVLRYKTIERVVMVDLDGELVEMCKAQLPEWHEGCFDDRRLELHHEDARGFLERCTEKFDAVIHDLPQPLEESPLRMLFTRECFARIREVLEPEGIVSIESTHAKLTLNRLHFLIRKTVERVFPDTVSIKAFIPSFATEWGYVLGAVDFVPGRLCAEEVDERIAERIGAPLEYYNGVTHAGYFWMSRLFNEGWARQTRIFEDAVPHSEALYA